MNETIYLIAVVISLVIFVGIMIARYLQNKELSKNYCMAELKLKKLPKDSPTRKRIEAAQKMFEKGWEVGSREREMWARAVGIACPCSSAPWTCLCMACNLFCDGAEDLPCTQR